MLGGRLHLLFHRHLSGPHLARRRGRLQQSSDGVGMGALGSLGRSTGGGSIHDRDGPSVR